MTQWQCLFALRERWPGLHFSAQRDGKMGPANHRIFAHTDEAMRLDVRACNWALAFQRTDVALAHAPPGWSVIDFDGFRLRVWVRGVRERVIDVRRGCVTLEIARRELTAYALAQMGGAA